MSSLDDILASMRGASSAPPPPSHEWTATAEEPSNSTVDEPPPLDNVHRVEAEGSTSLDYRFRCGALRLTGSEAETLCTDCSMAFALNSSNWLAATAEPRCALERLARSIFEAHTAGVIFDPATSGAEWWAQVRGGGHRHEGIEFHWDVDEHLCDLPPERGGTGLHVHPHLSTVTYLTKVGAPTLILDAGSPTAATQSAVASLYGPIRSGALSYPRLGKTVVFDGAKLHGAVPCRGGGAPAGQTRVTFLVNVWLGHRPHAVEALPASLAASMSQAWKPHATLGALSTGLAPPPKLRVSEPATGGVAAGGVAVGGAASGGAADAANAGGSQASSLLEVAFGRNDKVHAIRVPLPPPPAVAAGGGGADSYRLIFEAEAGAALGPNAGGLKCDRSGPAEKKQKKREEKGGSTDHGSGDHGSAGIVKRKKKKKHRLAVFAESGM